MKRDVYDWTYTKVYIVGVCQREEIKWENYDFESLCNQLHLKVKVDCRKSKNAYAFEQTGNKAMYR